MARIYMLLPIVSLALCIYCLIDLIRRPEDEIQHLPRVFWILLVLFFPLVGSIAWLVAGRPAPAAPKSRLQLEYGEYDRPGRAIPASASDDEAFLKSVRERAERQREEYRRQQRERERAEEAERQARRLRRESGRNQAAPEQPGPESDGSQ